MTAGPPERCRFFETEGLLRSEGAGPGSREANVNPNASMNVELHLAGCADCREEQRRIEVVREELRRLGPPASSPHWEQAIFARIAAGGARPGRRWWWVALPALAATAMVALFLRRPEPPTPAPTASASATAGPVLAMNFEAGGERLRGGDQPAVGGTVLVRASGLSGGHRELRLYRDDVGLVLRCSDQPPCGPLPDGILARWQIPSVGRYRVVALALPAPPGAPTGAYDRDLAALKDLPAGAVVEGTFEVW